MIGDRRGVDESEILRAYPCDDFVASPALQAWRTRRWAAPALSAGDLVMARRQLLNLKKLAERHHRQGGAPAPPP